MSLVELCVLLMDGAASDGEDFGDTGIEEAFAEDALADHACSSGEDDAHRVRLLGDLTNRRTRYDG